MSSDPICPVADTLSQRAVWGRLHGGGYDGGRSERAGELK
jgi:hypothetical protein